MNKTAIIAEPNKQEIIITRSFDAPRELVFKIWTDAEYLPEWWGPADMTTIVDSLDARVGGLWRFVHKDPQGNEYGHKGVFHEVAFPERLVNTYEFEGFPGVGLVTVTFEESGGKTKLTESTMYPSVEVRDGMLQSGMSEGVLELMDRLEQLLAKLQS